MSAETLRRAAALMRQRAESATPSPWRAYVDSDTGQAFVTGGPRDYELAEVHEWSTGLGNPEHIASWHPAVTLAVADWLDTAGADLWAHGPLCECTTGCDACDDNLWEPHVRDALTVARAYLGESA